MATKIGEINYQLSLDYTKFQKDLGVVSQLLTKTQLQMNDMSRNMTSVATNMGKIGGLGKDAATSIKDLSSSIKDLNTNASKFKPGKGGATDGFNNLFSSIKQIAGSMTSMGGVAGGLGSTISSMTTSAGGLGSLIATIGKLGPYGIAAAAGLGVLGGAVLVAKGIFDGFTTVVNFAVTKLGEFSTFLLQSGLNAVQYAGQVQQGESILDNFASRLGYTSQEVGKFRQQLVANGIELGGSIQVLNRAAESEIEFGDAVKLSRVAQDLAVINGINSTEAAMRLMTAIATNQTTTIRRMGLPLANLTGIYSQWAEANNRTVDSLDGVEKKQIIVEAVLKAGESVGGSYDT